MSARNLNFSDGSDINESHYREMEKITGRHDKIETEVASVIQNTTEQTNYGLDFNDDDRWMVDQASHMDIEVELYDGETVLPTPTKIKIILHNKSDNKGTTSFHRDLSFLNQHIVQAADEHSAVIKSNTSKSRKSFESKQKLVSGSQGNGKPPTPSAESRKA